MNESDKIKDAIWKCGNKVVALGVDKANTAARLAAIDKELLVLKRNIKRMNIELALQIPVEAGERKASKAIAAAERALSFERKFIINASKMLSRVDYCALVDASSEAAEVEA